MIIPLENVSFNLIPKLKKEIFIYPTDTIYGIGCDAENKTLVKKIREIKNRDKGPFSIIAPDFEWILANCKADEKQIKKYLPGPYTLILEKKKKEFLSHVSENKFLGVRIPNHKFTKILQEIKKPIVTTSVNLKSEKPANNITEINPKILEKVKIIINAGELSGKPSTLIRGKEIIKR
ncbi:MAG: L-threonylcarbamoyladenylate synthase [archaeon]